MNWFFIVEVFSGVLRSLSAMGKKQQKTPNKLIAYARGSVCVLVLFASCAFSSEQLLSEPTTEQFETVISKLKPEQAHGRGFKLEYFVNVPPEVFWRHKTSFDNQYLITNKFINSHVLVSREANVVITENEYSYKPKAVFKWQSTIYPEQYLLKYTLLNPDECGQKYHYGHISLQAEGAGTRVTQVAYFDFFGVSFWVNYPFKGGMSRFLKYTAQWEQQLVSELEHQYQE